MNCGHLFRGLKLHLDKPQWKHSDARIFVSELLNETEKCDDEYSLDELRVAHLASLDEYSHDLPSRLMRSPHLLDKKEDEVVYSTALRYKEWSRDEMSRATTWWRIVWTHGMSFLPNATITVQQKHKL